MSSEPAPSASQKAPPFDQELLTVAEACTRLRISRWTFYRLVQTHQLETVKIGSARRVPVAALRQFVDSLRGREGDAA
jgi:excisionase family DNA binding protein